MATSLDPQQGHIPVPSGNGNKSVGYAEYSDILNWYGTTVNLQGMHSVIMTHGCYCPKHLKVNVHVLLEQVRRSALCGVQNGYLKGISR